MRTEKIKSVVIFALQEEYYNHEVGTAYITSIEWGETKGDNAMLDTIKVYKNGELYSEHLFKNILGVYFETE